MAGKTGFSQAKKWSKFLELDQKVDNQRMKKLRFEYFIPHFIWFSSN